jgi:histidine ammonia-lyase
MKHITLANLYNDLFQSMQSLREVPSAVRRSREIVETALGDGRAYYGINTGFGALARERVPDSQLQELQRNLILSHTVGVGPPVPRDISVLMLQLKIHSLGLGYSGISLGTFSRLLWFVEQELVPVVPTRGSVGASGDLVPLAHMCLPLLGQGDFWDESGSGRRPAAECLAARGVKPIQLEAKDGLALINGTQFMSAYGCHVLHHCRRLVRMADLVAAMSLEALQGSIKPFDARIHEIRPFDGQRRVAANVRMLLADSEILESHRQCGKVQDPYSLRCVPQVHGASRDALDYAARICETEINSVTDNPLVFPDGEIISGGNFHGQPLAIVLDLAAIALAELGSISERRTYLLLEGHDGLPRLLMKNTGVNSGFMIPQYTAAALVSENKVLAHPASVDSIPTCLGQEDHVSMGSISAVKLLQVFENVEHVLAIELLTAAQALDYRLPLKPGRGVMLAHQYIRSQIPHREVDGLFYDAVGKAVECVRSTEMISRIEGELAALE